MQARIDHLRNKISSYKKFSTLSHDEKLTYCRTKAELFENAYKEFVKIKNDKDPKQTQRAAELCYIAYQVQPQKIWEDFHLDSNQTSFTENNFSDQDSSDAIFKKGLCYLFGIGHYPQSSETAYEYFKRCIEQDYLPAAVFAFLMHSSNLIAESNIETALPWLIKAAQEDDACAQHKLGYIYNKDERVKRNEADAFFWYQRAAEQGHSTSQFNLAILLDAGHGTTKDPAKAAYWYELAAEQDYINAQFNLGLLLEVGRDAVTKDLRKAAYWYQRAAEQGDAYAQFNLGHMFESDDGLTKDIAKAVFWYELAAEQDDADAQYSLGRMLNEGDGVNKNEWLAGRWLYLAADKGHKNAIKGLLNPKKDNLARKYYRALLEKNSTLFCELLCQHTEAQENLLSDLSEGFSKQANFLEKLLTLIYKIDLDSLPLHMSCLLINKVYVKIALLASKELEKSFSPHHFDTIMLFCKKIDPSQIERNNINNIFNLLTDSWMYLAPNIEENKEDADQICLLLKRLVYKILAMQNPIELSRDQLRLCASIVIKPFLAPYETLRFEDINNIEDLNLLIAKVNAKKYLSDNIVVKQNLSQNPEATTSSQGLFAEKFCSSDSVVVGAKRKEQLHSTNIDNVKKQRIN